jgi:hypothetical protein
LVIRMAEPLDDFGARHAGLNDLLAFADNVWSLTTVSANGSSNANSNTSTSSTTSRRRQVPTHSARARPIPTCDPQDKFLVRHELTQTHWTRHLRQ